MGRVRLESPGVAAIPDEVLDRFRRARNRIVHEGFSPRDASECAALIVTAGLPILSACYKDLHSFDLFDSFLLEYRGLLDVATAVVKAMRIAAGCRRDLRPQSLWAPSALGAATHIFAVLGP